MAKKLVKGEKKLFGVCSGLANYLDIDPTVVRILFIVAFLGFGMGLLIYIIMAIVMPEK
jgi:phage shock protein C